MRVRNLFVILTLMLVIKANATNYYFSSSQGDDSRTTSQAQNPSTPWKTLEKLNAWFPYLQLGDNVLFKCGDTFYGSIVTTKSGTSSSPIVLSSYGTGAKPTISGFTTISDWTSVGNGIYESNTLPAGSAINMVTINNKPYAMGRYPNANAGNKGYLMFEGHATGSITDNEKPAAIDNSMAGAQLVVRTQHYVLNRFNITGVVGNKISYSGTAIEGGVIQDKYGYFVQNSLKTLDKFGEWYYNPNSHKISVYFGSAGPAGKSVNVTTKDILLTVHASNITLDNICLSGANQYAVFNDWGGMNNLIIKNSSVVFSGINHLFMAGMNGTTIDNTLFNWANNNSLSFNNANNKPVITNSTFKNIGIYTGMIKPDIGGKYATGIVAQSLDSLTVQNCNFSNIGFIGVNFTYSNHTLIKNNTFENFCTALDDGGAIYSYTGSSNQTFTDRKVLGNIILAGSGAPEGTPDDMAYGGAFYLDDNCTDVLFDGNTIANGKYPGMFIHNSRGITITNNVIYNNAGGQMMFQHDGLASAITNCIIKHNQVFSKDADDLIVTLASVANDFTGIGSFDSNYYCRPFNESGITYTNWFSNKDGNYDLPGWQSTYNRDWHTNKTPIAVSDTSDILFQYNASKSTKTITLNGTYVGLDNVSYTGSINLDPYTSIILLRKNSLSKASASGNMNATAVAATNTSLKGPGYVKTESATLSVKAYPNPSSYYFNVTTKGGSTTEPKTLRVIDMSGRLVQVKTGITTNSTIQIGQDLMAGSYILELIQGNKKVEQKLIKLSN